MKTHELKKILKPLIKECIKEVMLEEGGVLSKVVSEVAHGMGATANMQIVSESKENNREDAARQQREAQARRKQADIEKRKKLLDSIGKEAFGGVNVFEGVEPLSTAGSVDNRAQGQGPLSGVAPNDPGVDISNLLGGASADVMKALVGKK